MVMNWTLLFIELIVDIQCVMLIQEYSLLWRKMGVLWWEIKYLKSAVTTFLKQKSIVPISGIWNEIQWNLDSMTIDLVTNRDLVDSFVSGHLFEVSYGWNPFKHFVITIPKCSFLSWDIPTGHLKVFFVTMITITLKTMIIMTKLSSWSQRSSPTSLRWPPP